MNFLQLVQRTKQETGISGNGPTTLVGLTGEMKRLADWVSQAWTELQNERSDWAFMRKSVTFLTSNGTTQQSGDTLAVGSVYKITHRDPADFNVNGQYIGAVDFGLYGFLQVGGVPNSVGAIYLIAAPLTLSGIDKTVLLGKQTYSISDIGLTDFRRWKNYSFRQYLQSAGVATEIILTQYLDYTQFRDFYELGSRRLVTGRPLYVCVAPDRSVKFGFTPNDVYVTTAEYYRSAQVLVDDTDVPIIPDEYHMLIVYRAARKYGYFEVASEQIEIAGREAASLYNNLFIDYGPSIEMGDSLI